MKTEIKLPFGLNENNILVHIADAVRFIAEIAAEETMIAIAAVVEKSAV